MRKKTVTIQYKCDFCGKEIDIEKEKLYVGVPVPCIRSYESEEGIHLLEEPYVDTVNLDLCEEHFNKLVKCYVVGAQGYDIVQDRNTGEDTGEQRRFRTKCGFPKEDSNRNTK